MLADLTLARRDSLKRYFNDRAKVVTQAAIDKMVPIPDRGIFMDVIKDKSDQELDSIEAQFKAAIKGYENFVFSEKEVTQLMLRHFYR